MADKYSSSASLMSAKDSSNQEHIISNATVKQALSEPFEIKAMLVSSGFDMQEQLGQFLTINRYFNESGSNTLNRSYNGIVTLIQHLGMDSNLQNHQYEITLKPWFWLLKHTHSFRVYQNQSTQEIVSDIFDNAGLKETIKYPACLRPSVNIVCNITNQILISFLACSLRKVFIIISSIRVVHTP